MVTTLTAFPFNLTPLTNISPFTYRDGITYLEKLEFLQKYIGDTLVPGANAALDDLLAQVQALIDTLGTETDTNRAELEARMVTLLADIAALLDANLANPCPLPGGGTNDEVALNAWFAAHAGKTVELWPLTYKISDKLDVSMLKTLEGNGALIDGRTIPAGTALAQRYGAKATGSLGTAIPLTTPIAVDATDIDGIAPGTFVVGDVVLVNNTEVPVTGLSRAERYKGELNTVRAVAGSLITLETGALFAYGATGLNIRKVNVVDALTVKNLTFQMGHESGGVTSGVGYTHNGIEVQYGRNPVIENVTSLNAEDQGITLRTCLGGTINNPTAMDCTSSLSYGSTGYGLALLDGTRDVVVNGGQFDRNRHHIAGGGVWPAVHNTINSPHGRYSSSYGFDTHESCFWWTFNHAEAHHSTHGFFTRGQTNTFNHCKSFDSSQESFSVHAFDDVTNQDAISFNDCEGHRGRYGLSATNVTKLRAKGFRFFDCGTNPVRVTNFDGLIIDGLEIYGSVGHAIRLEGTDVLHSKNVQLSNVTVNGAELNAVDVRYVDGVRITSGYSEGAGNYAVYLQDCTDTDTNGFHGKDSGYGHGYIERGSSHQVTGGSGKGSTNPAYSDGWRVNDSENFTIIGGEYANARWAVYTTLTEGVIQMGVNARNSGSKFKNELGVGVPPTSFYSAGNLI